MGKARKTKLKEYKPPRTSHYIVVANPLPIGSGTSDARFHDNLGNWLEWLTGKKALSIFYMSKMSSVVVELPGQMTDDVAVRLLGEHALRNPRTGQAHYSQVFEYDYRKYGCPDEIQRCSRGSYSIVAPQRLELPRPRECVFNPNVRFAKPNPPRATEANDPPEPDHHHHHHQQQQLDRVKQDPHEEDDTHQLAALELIADVERELQESSSAPDEPPPAGPTSTSRWQPYETPLENRARVGSRAPEHDVFNSRVQTVRVKPEPMDDDLPPPSPYPTKDEDHYEPSLSRDNSPEAGSVEYYRRALEEAQREVTLKEEPQGDSDWDEHSYGDVVKREPRGETVSSISGGIKEEVKPTIKREPSVDSIPKTERMRSTTLASERQPSVKHEPRESLAASRNRHRIDEETRHHGNKWHTEEQEDKPSIKQELSGDLIAKPERMRSTTLASERQSSVKQEPWDSLPPSRTHRHPTNEEPRHNVKSEPPIPPRLPTPAMSDARPTHCHDIKPIKTRYSPSRDPRRRVHLASECPSATDRRKRGHESTGRDGAGGKRVKTEYEEY